MVFFGAIMCHPYIPEQVNSQQFSLQKGYVFVMGLGVESR
jgi:hypothetical protein